MPSFRRYAGTVAKYAPAAQKRYRVYAPAVKQLAKDVAYIGSLVNSEPHYHIVTTSNNFDYNGVVLALSNIPQGDGIENRDGNRVLPRFMNLKGYVSITSATTRTDCINVRAILFRFWGEKAVGAASVTPSDVLATIGSQYAPLSPLNDNIVGSRGDRSRRIEVHRSWDLLLDNNGGSPGIQLDCNVTLNNPGSKNKEHIQFDSSSTADPQSGGFYLLFISDDAVSTQVHYKFTSKLTYYDN